MFKHVIKMRLPAIKKILFGEGKVAGQKMKLVSGKRGWRAKVAKLGSKS